MSEQDTPLQLVLITGMSGSGKSVALHALEDAGYFCVDNLPPELLRRFITLEKASHASRLAIAMDVRSATALPLIPKQLATLRRQGLEVKCLFLDASTGTLVRRYSESRRKHPLSSAVADAAHSNQRRALVDAIEIERGLLLQLRQQSHLIDTSLLLPAQLQSYVKSLLALSARQMTLVFESFAFKRGVPRDADYVFDVRMLANPHYQKALSPLTGQDPAVAKFLLAHADVVEMRQHIGAFLERWLPGMARDHRAYVTVAIGCTGGQHRSVFFAEQLAAMFAQQWPTLIRHRDVAAG